MPSKKAPIQTPRPPAFMVLNEPETSLHPNLLPALARLIATAAKHTQIIVVSHAAPLIQALEGGDGCWRLHLEKSFGETLLAESTPFTRTRREWPAR